MGVNEKLILKNMIFDKLLSVYNPGRGSTKSLVGILYTCHLESIKRTNYVLSAINESL